MKLDRKVRRNVIRVNNLESNNTGDTPTPLKAVKKNSNSPHDMWQKLSTIYAGNTTSNKLNLITEAIGKNKSKRESTMDDIGELETSFTKHDNVVQPLNELTQVSILLSSIKEDYKYDAVIAAIRTMDE